LSGFSFFSSFSSSSFSNSSLYSCCCFCLSILHKRVSQLPMELQKALLSVYGGLQTKQGFGLKKNNRKDSTPPSLLPLLLCFSASLSIAEMDPSLRECCVCHEALQDPMGTLPCLHSACLTCLIKSDLFILLLLFGPKIENKIDLAFLLVHDLNLN